MLFGNNNNNMNKSNFGNSQLNQGLLLSGQNNFNNSSPNNDNITYIQNQAEVPKDSAEQIVFSPTMPNMFAVISWDCSVRLYNIYNNSAQQKACVNLTAFPLAVAWKADGSGVYVSTSDNTLSLVNFNTNGAQKVANSTSPICKMVSVPQLGLLICADSNKTLLVYTAGNPNPVCTLPLRFQVIDMAVSQNVLLLALSNSHSTFVDIQSLNSYNQNDLEYTASALKSPLSTCGVNAQTREFVLSSVDGRSQKGVFNSRPVQAMGQTKNIISYQFQSGNNTSNFIFISHSQKSKTGNISNMYNVASCGFNSKSPSFFFTAGGDGSLIFWDVKVKNKISSFNVGKSITAAGISGNGEFIAFSTGYDWAKGVWGLGEVDYTPKIGIKLIGNNELVFATKANFR